MGWDKQEFNQFNEIFKNQIDNKNLSLTEIQYIRGLIYADQLEGNYKELGMNAKIDQKTSMYEFTNKILNKLDKLEDGLN